MSTQTKTLYVAGPMSGLPDFNYPAFFAAAKELEAAGYVVENPAANETPDGATWLGFMRLSLVQISKSDGIALLPGWKASKGASLEVHIAEALELPVHSPVWWLRNADVSPSRRLCDPAI